MASIDYGKITVDSASRDTDFSIVDIFAIHSTMTINDDPWELEAPRYMEFVNLEHNRNLIDVAVNYDFGKANTEPEDLIKVRLIQMGNVGMAYTRYIRTVNDVAAELGGQASAVFVFLTIAELIFGTPYRQLDLAISF